jgi:hypothetical protein
MPPQITVGIDNGQSGSIGILGAGRCVFEKIPTQAYLHYGKKGTIGQRLNRGALESLLEEHLENLEDRGWQVAGRLHVFIERPFSGKFMNAVLPAHRFFEATIIVMEDMFAGAGLGYEVVDSGPWQKGVLGNVKGSAELKKASLLRGIQLYPQFKDIITKHGDADGLLMAHHYHNLHA